MGLPTAIVANMTSEQLEAYTLHLRIEEISQKLRINDVVPADGDRSPSPPPQYDNHGRRVNTREYRYRKRLEDERHKLVEKAMKTIPNYHPPQDYRRPTKTQEKVYVPVNDYPEINFIGLLIGPRGNTLKKMESESGAKIAIRGKGSVKEGKGRSDAVLAAEMLSTANTSNSCKNWAILADPPLVSKLVRALSTMAAAAMRNLGNEAQPVPPLPGAPVIMTRVAKVVQLLPGVIAIVAMITTEATTTVAKAKAKATTMILPPPERHLGTNLRPPSPNTPVTLAIQATAELLVWDRLLVFLRRMVPWVLRPDCHLEISML
ncbi:hypothetical protein F4677DRAFT_141207 [Hypoxylon crocopeplum]|nr:hypothetical protein F4677DRAFT_141207 [Hypoxylon crocopeplum]